LELPLSIVIPLFGLAAMASFFFALAESALFSLGLWRARRLVASDAVRGGSVLRLLENSSELLATLVLGNSVANATLVALGLMVATAAVAAAAAAAASAVAAAAAAAASAAVVAAAAAAAVTAIAPLRQLRKPQLQFCSCRSSSSSSNSSSSSGATAPAATATRALATEAGLLLLDLEGLRIPVRH